MNRVALFITVFALINIIITGCDGQKKIDTSKLSPKEMFEMKCSHCHNLPNTTTYKGEDWIPTVVRMQSKNPAWISDEEAKKVQGYLSSLAANTK